MDYSLPGSSVHWILQARILEWLSVPFSRETSYTEIEPRSLTLQANSSPAEPPVSPRILDWVHCLFFRGSSWSRNWTKVPCIVGGIFINWATGKPPSPSHFPRSQSCGTESFDLLMMSVVFCCCFFLSHSVVSLLPHGLYSPWNSPGQNTGMGSLSLLQGIFSTQELNQGLLHCRRILHQLSYQGRCPKSHLINITKDTFISSLKFQGF